MHLRSRIYVYPICRAKFTITLSSLSDSYVRDGFSGWEPRDTIKEPVYTDCVYLPRRACSLTDELSDEIRLHWERTRILGNLQLDLSQTLPEYRAFRVELATLIRDNPSFGITKAGFTRLDAAERYPVHGPDFDDRFIERFHKATCLQAIAILARRLALATNHTSEVLDISYWACYNRGSTISGRQL